MLDLDWIAVWIDADLPGSSRSRLDGSTESYRGETFVKFNGMLSPDARVVAYPGRTIVKGSPHKHLRGESVGRFGPTETRDYAAELSDRLDLPLDTVLAGRVSRFDLSANLVLNHDPAEYIRLASPPKRMYEVGSGPGSTVFKHGRVGILLYDKVAKVKRRHRHLIPANWKGRNVLRVEVRFGRPALEFRRRVTLADLCDDAFWLEAAERWLVRATSIPLAPEVCAVPFAPTPSGLRSLFAARGIQASGGRIAAIRRISEARKSGSVTPVQAKALRRYVATVMVDLEDDEAHLVVPLADELAIAIRTAPTSTS